MNAKIETRPVATVTRDPEVVALSRVLKVLDSLSEAARQRIVGYVASKYTSPCRPVKTAEVAD
jgi:hypothetical protein